MHEMSSLVVGTVKRVLNSGTVKLPYIKGTEKDILECHQLYYPLLSPTDVIKGAFELDDPVMGMTALSFTFEIKAPLLTFLTFQDSNLGTLNRLDDLDHPIAYLPPQFYTKDDSGYTSMSGNQSNIYTTKLYNFYNAAFNFYNNLLKEGLCKEEASLVLPQGMFINFLWVITAKDLIDFIEKHHTDSPELYGYCSTLVLYLEEHAPKLVRWLKLNRWQTFSL